MLNEVAGESAEVLLVEGSSLSRRFLKVAMPVLRGWSRNPCQRKSWCRRQALLTHFWQRPIQTSSEYKSIDGMSI